MPGAQSPAAVTRRVTTGIVALFASSAVTPIPATVVARRDGVEDRLELVHAGPVRLGHEHRGLGRVEHVEVERDVRRVDAVRAPARASRRCPSRPGTRPLAGRGSVRRRAQRPRDGRRRRRAASAAASPTGSPDGEVSGVLRSPWASSQTTASRPPRVASPRTAPTCAQQQPPRTNGRSGSEASIAAVCSSSESRSTTPVSGYGSSRDAPLLHRVAARRPRPSARARGLPRTSARTGGTRSRARCSPP